MCHDSKVALVFIVFMDVIILQVQTKCKHKLAEIFSLKNIKPGDESQWKQTRLSLQIYNN